MYVKASKNKHKHSSERHNEDYTDMPQLDYNNLYHRGYYYRGDEITTNFSLDPISGQYTIKNNASLGDCGTLYEDFLDEEYVRQVKYVLRKFKRI